MPWWTFTPNNAAPYGVSITSQPGDTHAVADEFTNWSINSTYDQVSVDDKNETGGDTYAYTVTITDGTTTLTSDPIIRNRN